MRIKDYINEPINFIDMLIYELDRIELERYAELEPQHMELGIRNNRRKRKYGRTDRNPSFKGSSKAG